MRQQRDRAGNRGSVSFPADMEPCPRYEVDGWDAVFDWWYRVGRAELGTLVKLAAHMGVSVSTLYNKHPEYKAQYGEQPMDGGQDGPV
jgi:hypothetical protein